MLCRGELAEQYKTNFFLAQNYQYRFSDIDNMIPYERDIYQTLLLDWLEAEKKRINSQTQG